MTRPLVYLCAGDEAGWAIDEDLRLTREAITPFVQFVDHASEASVVHAVWWEPLVRIPAEHLAGKHVVCHMAGDPVRCWGEPRFLKATRRVTAWIAQSRAAMEKLRAVGAPVRYAPYTVETAVFGATQAPQAVAERAAEELRALGADTYVIANFHRDTEGAGIATAPAPKLVKGPDVFCEILAELRRRGRRVAALLAGPRRHWVCGRLADLGVPFVFAGARTPGDDYPRAILPRQELAALYRLANLCLITSRSEGGPRAVLEAGAASLPVLSSRVGHAPDVLPAQCLFGDVMEAVERIEADMDARVLRRTVPIVRAAVDAHHTTEAVGPLWRQLYAEIRGPVSVVEQPAAVKVPSGPKVLSLWNKFTPPPWGGGNQFMIALEAQARRMGVECVRNEAGPRVSAHVVNSVQFEMERFESLVAPGSARVVHRIDGPISTIRGTPESLEDDRRCIAFNRRYASATVIQSWHTRRSLRELGLEPVRPVLILNACDPETFYRPSRARETGGRVRLVATSWSPNPGKGAAVYEWLDQHLDHSRVEFTFVGNIKGSFTNTRVLPPLPSDELADLLRTQDIYLTASRNDPCSNALIEALACGLPAIYLNSGGHPELVEFGGLPFERPDEIPALVDRVARFRAVYSELCRPPTMADVCRRYLALAFDDEAFAP
ncbi:MAG: glycosyltransferase family 4 protein [Phycisphaerales bacterium]